MNSLGVVPVMESTKNYIRQKLKSEFAGALHIFPSRNYLSICELAKEKINPSKWSSALM